MALSEEILDIHLKKVRSVQRLPNVHILHFSDNKMLESLKLYRLNYYSITVNHSGVQPGCVSAKLSILDCRKQILNVCGNFIVRLEIIYTQFLFPKVIKLELNFWFIKNAQFIVAYLLSVGYQV